MARKKVRLSNIHTIESGKVRVEIFYHPRMSYSKAKEIAIKLIKEEF